MKKFLKKHETIIGVAIVIVLCLIGLILIRIFWGPTEYPFGP